MDTFVGQSQKIRIDVSSIEIESKKSSTFGSKHISCDKITKVDQRGNSVFISVGSGFYASPTEIEFNDRFEAERAYRAVYNATPMSWPLSIEGNTLYIGGRYSFHGKSIRISDIQEASANGEGKLTIRCKHSYDSFSIQRRNPYEARKEADMINARLQKTQDRSNQSDFASWVIASGRSSSSSTRASQASQESTQTQVQPKVRQKKTSVFRNVVAIVIVLILCSLLNRVIDNDRSASVSVSAQAAMIDYIGLTVGDIEDMFGTDYTTDYWEGGYNMYYSDTSGCPYVFIYNPPDMSTYDGHPNRDYTITGISCFTLNSVVFGDAKIGMPHSDFEKAIGQTYKVDFPIGWSYTLPGDVLTVNAQGANGLQNGAHKLIVLEDNSTVVFALLWRISEDS